MTAGATERTPDARWWRLRWVVVGAGCAISAAGSPAAFRIAVTPLQDGSIEIAHVAEPDQYYIVYESAHPADPGVPVAVWQSPSGVSIQPSDASCYFRVGQVSVQAPLDVDGDGIDDAFELGSPVLDPLAPGDAQLDPDGDGVDSLTEYRQGRNPAVPALPDVGETLHLEIYTPLDPA